MNAVQTAWNKIFHPTGSKGGDLDAPPSPQQCALGTAVFGSDDPNIQKQCDRYRAQFKALVQKQADEIIGQLQAAVNDLAEEILEFDERLVRVESAEREKRFLTPRMSAAMFFADDPASSLSQIGRKAKVDRPAGSASWIDAAQHIAGKDAERRREATKSQHFTNRMAPGLYRKKFDFE